MIVIHSLIRCPTVSQFMSQGFTPAHALLDLLLELLSWPCMPNYDIVRIAVTTLSLFRFPFPFSVSTFRFHFPFPPFTASCPIYLPWHDYRCNHLQHARIHAGLNLIALTRASFDGVGVADTHSMPCCTHL